MPLGFLPFSLPAVVPLQDEIDSMQAVGAFNEHGEIGLVRTVDISRQLCVSVPKDGG